MLKKLDNENLMNLAYIGNSIKGVAHNINTPLSAVIGRAEMLQMRINKIFQMHKSNFRDEDIAKCMKDINILLENSNKVSAIVKNMMKKSINAESNKIMKLKLDAILFDELEFLNADMFFKHNINKKYCIQKNAPPIMGVYCHFSNCFLEILENSKNALADTELKNICVELSYTDDSITLQISDTGCGISPDTLANINGMFDAKNSIIEQIGDSSGLSRVAKLMHHYNASVYMKSSPGNTVVTIKIPIVKKCQD